MPSSTPTRPQRRRSGRPTPEQAAQLDQDVREAALALFLEHGYEGTTMDAIARVAGTTKASLYSRFDGKEAVFRSVLDWTIRRPDWPFPEPDPPDLDDLEGALTAIAHAALRRALDPAMVKLSRIAVAEAPRFPDLARRTQEAGNRARVELVVALLTRHAATGAIVADEPEILAEIFLAMVATMPARRVSFGYTIDRTDLAHRTEVAVRLFVRGLRP